jgi:hypothetical protein
MSMIGFVLFVLGTWLGGAALEFDSGQSLPALATAILGIQNVTVWAFLVSK